MFYLITFNSIPNIGNCILQTPQPPKNKKTKKAIISRNLKEANKGTNKRASLPRNIKQK